ncbi:hypothetical protein DFS34DRAFT_85596 [Phlyctochytrium arcticum]|nr:hypothetical protein DFS34DRAFT_85596 [Phlyctochytrium arcticum]
MKGPVPQISPELLKDLPPVLQTKCTKLIAAYPPSLSTIQELLGFITKNISKTEAANDASKKRKLDTLIESDSSDYVCTIDGLSFTSPARKKFSLRIHENSLHLVSIKEADLIEHSYESEDLAYAFCLPTPEKPKPHWTICLLAKNGKDSIVFGFDDQSANLVITNGETGESNPVSKKLSCKAIILDWIRKALRFDVIEPMNKVFRARRRAGDFHVNCYMKAKDGHLYPLSTGIFFGLKKPIVFLPFSKIARMHMFAPTGRHFNLSIQTFPDADDGADAEEIDFSMIDPEETDGLTNYIEKHSRRFGEGQNVPLDAAGDKSKRENDVSQAMAEIDEEEDEDFVPSDREEVGEEWDSDHDSDASDHVPNSRPSRHDDASDEGSVEEADLESEEEESQEGDTTSASKKPAVVESDSESEDEGENEQDDSGESSPTAEAPPPRGMAAIAARIALETAEKKRARK